MTTVDSWVDRFTPTELESKLVELPLEDEDIDYVTS